MQCVLESDAFGSARALNLALRDALGWDADSARCRICVKSLAQSGLHTLHGMLGYCMKYQAEQTPERPFEMHHSGVTTADLQKGREEYAKLGRPNKHRVELTPANIIDKAHMFTTLKLRGVNDPEFDKVVGLMVASGKYILSHQWAKESAHLDRDTVQKLWLSRTSLSKFTGEDLSWVLYGGRVVRGKRWEHPPEHYSMPLLDRVQRGMMYDVQEEWGADEDEDVYETPLDVDESEGEVDEEMEAAALVARGAGEFLGDRVDVGLAIAEVDEVMGTPSPALSPRPSSPPAPTTAAASGWRRILQGFTSVRAPARRTRSPIPENMCVHCHEAMHACICDAM
jgi:hypothetical protein